MLLKLPEWLGRNKSMSIPHKGIVMDNADPDKIGRVKANIPGLLNDFSTDDLPWIAPLNPYGLGGGSGLSSFSVPEVGSTLTIVFPYDDIYVGFYIGYWQDASTHQSDFDADYPETYGWRDSTGLILTVNKSQQTINLDHPSGVNINVDSAGNISITAPGNDTIAIGGNVDLTVGGNVTATVTGNMSVSAVGNAAVVAGGNVALTAVGAVAITGASVTIISPALVVNSSGPLAVTASAATVTAGTVTLAGGNVVLGAGGAGVVTGSCVCAYTGDPHPESSSKVFAEK